jgi:hypothetical protein
MLVVVISLACNLPARLGLSGAGGFTGPAALASFGPLAKAHGPAVTADVSDAASTVQLDDGDVLEVPAGAFEGPNQLQVTRYDVAFDQIATDVMSARFYVIATREDVPSLGAPVILSVAMPTGQVSVSEYDGEAWQPVPVAKGSTTRVEIAHFSESIFGFLEWWAERDEMLGETIDSMDSSSPQVKLQNRIEGGTESTRQSYGVGDQAAQADTDLCAQITAMLTDYNHAGNRKFPPDVSGHTQDLLAFLHSGSSAKAEGGYFWDLTADSMEVINNKLLDSSSQVSPADFLRIAIDANGGNIPLGVLAAHNYLKNITYEGRDHHARVPEEYGQAAGHLQSWREGSNINSEGVYDKMGPIYHVFAAMTGGLWLPTSYAGPVIINGEAFLRTFRVGQDRPDVQKAGADQCGADAADWLRTHQPVVATEAPGAGEAGPSEGRFEASDCAVPGLDFTQITVDFSSDGPNPGPYLNCKTDEMDGFLISPWADPAQLDSNFTNATIVSKGFVDQANEWNSDPTLPPSLLAHVNLLHDESDRYVVVITQYSNTRNCLTGLGLGEEKVDGKFDVHLNYTSVNSGCGPSDPEAYVTMMQNLETAALAAIARVEGKTSP